MVGTSSITVRLRNCLAVLLLGCFVPVQAQPVIPELKPDSKTGLKPEEMQLPTDAILVICERAADFLRVLPRYYYVVPPEKYDALQAEVDRLQRELKARQPVSVNLAARLTGQVRANVLEATGTFEFATDRPRTPVSLSCRQAFPTSILLGDKVPRLTSSPTEGLVLEVDQPGKDHKAVVKMLLPLRDTSASVPRAPANEPMEGFELDLPLAPVLEIDLTLPAGVSNVEINDQPLSPLVQLNGTRLKGFLEKGGRLKVAWRKAAAVPATPVALTTVRAQLVVRMTNTRTTTTADLTVQDPGGVAQEWVLRIPERATVELPVRADRDRAEILVQDGQTKVRLRSPSSAPLVVRVVADQARARPTDPVLLGPFALEGAIQQSGTIYVLAEGNQRVRVQSFRTDNSAGALEVARRGLNRESADRPPPGTVAAFQYWSPQSSTSPATRDPWFRLEVASVQGMLSTQAEHVIRLLPGDSWRLTMNLNVTPVQTGVDSLRLEWPAPWRLDRSRLPAVATLSDKEVEATTLRFELNGEPLKPFQIPVESLPVPTQSLRSLVDAPRGSAILPLPRPSGTYDRGEHRVTLLVPDQFDVSIPQPPNPVLELIRQDTHRLEYRSSKQFDRFPEQVAIAWKPYQLQVRVDSLADVQLTGGGIRVTQKITYRPQAGAVPPAQLELPVPPAVNEVSLLKTRLVAGEVITEEQPLEVVRNVVRCPLDVSANPTEFTLTYRVNASSAGTRPAPGSEVDGERVLPIALFCPPAATQGQSRVRIWAEPGARVRVVEKSWEEAPLEEVAGRPSFPTMILRSQRPELPLTLRYDRSLVQSAPSVVRIDRALVQAVVGDGGVQQYRIRMLVRYPESAQLDLVLPAPLSTVDLQASLGNRRLSWEAVEESGAARSEGTSIARIRLPRESNKQPAILEVTYQLISGRTGDTSGLRSQLQPLTIAGVRRGIPTRWQVEFPSNWVPLSLEMGPATAWGWGWRGWLLMPHPTVTASDLEVWLRDGNTASLNLSEEQANHVPSFVCWRGELTPLVLYHAPQQAWLLICSLSLLGLGLGLYLLPVGPPATSGAPNRLFWPMLALLGLTTAGVGLIWPGLLGTILYGIQPGLLVFAVVLGVQWLLHERYRRRVVFLPGFRRLKTGSSLVRPVPAKPASSPREEAPRQGSSAGRLNPGAGSRGRVEQPSTIDEPTANGE